MFGNFSAVLPVTLKYEGLWSDHAADPGGATMKGVTLAVYRKYRPGASKADLRAISETEVEMIYRDGYWKPIKGDDLPYGVDLATFDFGVNSGVSRASKYLQRVVGVDQDGKIGSGTLSAVRSASGKEVIQGLCGSRLSFVRALGTFKVFGKGWSRRIADVEARAVAMSLAAGAVLTPAARTELFAESDKADATAAAHDQKAGGAVVGGTGAGSIDAISSGGPNWLLIAGLAVVVIAAAVVFIVKSRQQKERAEAYAAVAAE